MKQTTEWWRNEAARAKRRDCPKCRYPMAGIYIPPNRDGDCGVAQKCRQCGLELVILTGVHWEPKGPPVKELPTVRGANSRRTLHPARIPGSFWKPIKPLALAEDDDL